MGNWGGQTRNRTRDLCLVDEERAGVWKYVTLQLALTFVISFVST